MRTFKAGLMVCSLFCAAAPASICAAAEHATALHANVAAFIEKTRGGMAGQIS
jgi:hypothetical protein